MIDSETRLYCLLGNPVAKSLSPVIHNAAFREINVNAVYLAFCVDDLAGAVNGIRALPISGASVTIPYKTAVLKYLDDLDDAAREMGAVNTLLWREGRLVGSNTDGLGAVLALKEKTEIPGRRCLVLGAGGAARGISLALKKEGCRVAITNRTEEKGRAIAEELGLNWVPFREFWRCGADILVQATSVGMYPNTNETLIPGSALSSFQIVMDIVYKPIETRLLREAGEAGCITIDGLGMLIYQAAAQLRLWTGAEPPIDAMRRAAAKYLCNAG
ncbi:MAG: shikimate dehydrogenase [Pseudomonadota bacterium]